MTESHTPGPWEVFENERRFSILPAPEKPGYICHIAERADKRIEAANAMLIAAAPDLLEACLDFVSKLDDFFAGKINIRPDFADRASAAIAKATKEG